MSSSIAPFLIFFAGAVLVALTRGWARSVVLLAVPIVGALNLWALDGAEPVTVGLLDYTLTIARADRLSMLEKLSVVSFRCRAKMNPRKAAR